MVIVQLYLIFFIIIRKRFKKIIKSVANSKINETYALSKLKIIDLANKGDKIPVQFLLKNIKRINILKM